MFVFQRVLNLPMCLKLKHENNVNEQLNTMHNGGNNLNKHKCFCFYSQ